MRGLPAKALGLAVLLGACLPAGDAAPAAPLGDELAAAASPEGQRIVAGPADAVPGQLVVVYEPGAGAGARAAARHDAGVRAVDGLAPSVQLVKTSERRLAGALEELRDEPAVRQASRNWLRHATVVPDDPLFGQLWGLHNAGQPIGQGAAASGTPDADIDAPEAWDLQPGWGPGPEPVVAVMDTGVDLGHRDLASRLWTNPGEVPGNGLDDDGNGYADDLHGYDFAGAGVVDPLDGDADPDDPDGHGTHVAGTILAEGDDGEGIAGVAPRARAMALKVCALDAEEEVSCPLAAMVEAYAYAIDNGARVLNGSLGGAGFAPAELVLLGGSPEVLFVFAAGNDGVDNETEPSYPCGLDELPGYAADNLLCVAATNLNDGLASFSNYGAASVDLGAPGVRTLSAYPEALVDTTGFLPYVFLSGTSMATPHVSGAAALLLAAAPEATPADARAAIMATVDPRPALAGKTVSGGRLNLRGAIERVLPEPLPEDEGEPIPEGEGEPEGGAGPPAPGPADQLAPGPAPVPATAVGAPAAGAPLPRAFFRQRPGRTVRTGGRRASVLFRFGSEPPGAGFVCSVDRRRLRPCAARLRLAFTVGRHVLLVRAHDGGGRLGPGAVHRFRVKQVRR